MLNFLFVRSYHFFMYIKQCSKGRYFGTFLVRKKVHKLKLEGTVTSMSVNELCDAINKAVVVCYIYIFNYFSRI